MTALLGRATESSIHNQFSGMLKRGKNKETWEEVYRKTRFWDPFKHCATEMAVIHQAGLYLELDLIFRARDDSVEAAQGSLKLKFEHEVASLCYPTSQVGDPKLSHSYIGSFILIESFRHRHS